MTDPEEGDEDMAKQDKFEKDRWNALGRGYREMTDEEVAKDLKRRFGDIDFSKDDKRKK